MDVDKNKAVISRLFTQNRNKWTAAVILGGVLGIYVYTMSAVKQEDFLDDFDPPKH